MPNPRKVLAKILSGSKSIPFDDFLSLLSAYGFRLSRVSGSHHIFIHPDVKELVNLQEIKGQVKPYQVQQVMKLVERYDLIIKEKP